MTTQLPHEIVDARLDALEAEVRELRDELSRKSESGFSLSGAGASSLGGYVELSTAGVSPIHHFEALEVNGPVDKGTIKELAEAYSDKNAYGKLEVSYEMPNTLPPHIMELIDSAKEYEGNINTGEARYHYRIALACDIGREVLLHFREVDGAR